MSALVLSTDVTGGIAVIALGGELDVAGSSALDRELVRVLAERTDARGLVVDLTRLEFMDSTGLRALVLADRRVRDAGVRFALVPGPDSVQRVFALTRMDQHLRFVAHPVELAGE